MTQVDILETDVAHAGAKLAELYRIVFPDDRERRFEGQLLRPVLALAGAGRAARDDDRVWYAALAVQLAHEASLVHDDIVDAAPSRRGKPTTCATRGVGAAVLEGDLLLTSAYVAAAHTRSDVFMAHFAGAVSRTVIAERRQGAAMGQRIDSDTYREIAAGKSGELMGCALAAAALINESSRAAEFEKLGREIGLLYQMLDDLLDYCTAGETGKEPLGDYAQGRWTWLLDEIPSAALGLAVGRLLATLHACADGDPESSAFERAARRLRDLIGATVHDCASVLDDGALVCVMMDRWLAVLDRAVEREHGARAGLARQALTAQCDRVVSGRGGEIDYLTRNSRSFRFASRLLPRRYGGQIARVYAFCRFTDDIVDEPPDLNFSSRELLNAWEKLANESYNGTSSGIALVDDTMSEMATADVPFELVRELCSGMRMDLDEERYASLDALRIYTYRVAGVVGIWVARLGGVRDPLALQHAEQMGRAMQLTNILRDVGEDWRRGRMYLPLDVLERHGLTMAEIGEMVSGSRRICDSYRALMRELMGVAAEDYRAAFAWLPSLPAAIQPCMAIAAWLYEGIHIELLRNDFDNLGMRAATSLTQKISISTGALRALRRVRLAASRSSGTALATGMTHGWQG